MIDCEGIFCWGYIAIFVILLALVSLGVSYGIVSILRYVGLV